MSKVSGICLRTVENSKLIWIIFFLHICVHREVLRFWSDQTIGWKYTCHIYLIIFKSQIRKATTSVSSLHRTIKRTLYYKIILSRYFYWTSSWDYIVLSVYKTSTRFVRNEDSWTLSDTPISPSIVLQLLIETNTKKRHLNVKKKRPVVRKSCHSTLSLVPFMVTDSHTLFFLNLLPRVFRSCLSSLFLLIKKNSNRF